MMSKKTLRLNLFQYIDYRGFLRDWYLLSKQSRAFSLRTFAKRAGFGSPSFFQLVMKGKRNLTEKSLGKFMTGLGLNKQEQEFFRNLVFFNQSGSHQEKDFYYQHLLQSRKFNQLKPIEKQHYEYYSTWYHPVIREMAVSAEFDGTPEWLATHLSPPITPAQAEKSLALLERLGFLVKKEPGRWQQAATLVSTGPELQSLVVHNYHKTLLDLTKEVLETVPPAERDVSTLTLGIIRQRGPELKKKIQEFRKEALKLVSVDIHPEEVVQLNIQLFPLTKPFGKKEGA